MCHCHILFLDIWYWANMLQNTETHRLIFTTHCLLLLAYLTLSIGCDLRLQIHDTVENTIKLGNSSHCVSALVLSFAFWKIKQWPTKIQPDSPVDNVASYVLKFNKSIRIWDLFHWRFSPQIKIAYKIMSHFLLFYPQKSTNVVTLHNIR